MAEVWREIEEFPGYAISTDGRIKNIKTRRILKLANNGRSTQLRRDGVTHYVRVMDDLWMTTFATTRRDGTNLNVGPY